MDSKVCTDCKTEKLYSEYAPDKRKIDGLQSACRECQNRNKRNYYRRNPEKKAEECARHYKKNKKEILRKQKIYNQRPEIRRKHNVRGAAYRALQNGVLIKQPCEVCEEPEVQMHHEDYNKPLEVKWLCKKHHKL